MKDTLTVGLGNRSYPIILGNNLDADIEAILSGHREEKRQYAVITDEHVSLAHKAFFEKHFSGSPVMVLPAGEFSKDLSVLGRVYDFLAANRIDRTSSLFAVGGGVIGDLAGFAAASYLRGIVFYQVPTTLLAMVDSSVGGKTGINLEAGKNLVGAFYQPKAVLADMRFLRTLPPREFSAGMAEVLKYGLLGDAGLWEKLCSAGTLTPTHSELPGVIKTCCEIKARVVAEDETETAEQDGRALLNLGHTFGHAIEKVAGYGIYLHGEAVACGLVLAARLSQELGYLNATAVSSIMQMVLNYHLPAKLRETMSLESLMKAMGSDKKVKFGKLKFVVLHKIGEAHTDGNIETALVEKLWREAGAE